MRLFILALTLFFSSHCLANGWVSSGGELFRDAKNPWFVRSTSMVQYCIRVESEGFSAPIAEVESAVKEGIQYWKGEFSRSNNLADGTFELGTQTFEQVACSENVDIEFLFGYNTLNKEQIAHLKDPKKFIGVTVRTKYDLKNLKAKGFVFFSSDYGVNAYDNTGNLIDKAWSHPRILRYAILHELGHIFGIPHMGSGLMSEVFLNQILNKSLVETYEKTPVESFLRPSTELELCMPGAALFLSPKWFGVTQGYDCFGIFAPAVFGTWKVFVKKDKDAPKEDIGEIRNVSPNLADQRGRPVTILELGDQQTVFTAQEAIFRSYMMGPMLMEMGFTGTYIPKSTGKPQPLYISMTPSSLTMTSATSASKIEPVFVFNSPISVLLIKGPKP